MVLLFLVLYACTCSYNSVDIFCFEKMCLCYKTLGCVLSHDVTRIRQMQRVSSGCKKQLLAVETGDHWLV